MRESYISPYKKLVQKYVQQNYFKPMKFKSFATFLKSSKEIYFTFDQLNRSYVQNVVIGLSGTFLFIIRIR